MVKHRIATLLLFGAACGPLVTEPMPDIPETVDYDTVRVEYGEDDLLSGTSSLSALVGDPSGLSAIAQGYIRGTNFIIRTNIHLIERVTRTRPTEWETDRWMWDNLTTRVAGEKPSRFQIEKIGEGEFTYLWEVGDTDDTLEEVFSGVFRQSPSTDGRQQGEGVLRFQFSAMARHGVSDDPQDGRGVIAFRALGGVRQVHATFFDVVNSDAPDPATTSYRYTQFADGRGRFAFATETNFLQDGEPLEVVAIDAGWLANRVGRAEASLTGGSLMVNEVLLDECWDSAAATTYANATPDIPGNYEDGTPDSCDEQLAELQLSPPSLGPPQGDPEIPEPHPDEDSAQ